MREETRRGEAHEQGTTHPGVEQRPRRLAAERHEVAGREADDGDA